MSTQVWPWNAIGCCLTRIPFKAQTWNPLYSLTNSKLTFLFRIKIKIILIKKCQCPWKSKKFTKCTMYEYVYITIDDWCTAVLQKNNISLDAYLIVVWERFLFFKLRFGARGESETLSKQWEELDLCSFSSYD